MARRHAHLVLTDNDPADGSTLASADLPATATAVSGLLYWLVVPPSALEPLGMTSQVAGLVAPTSNMPTSAQLTAASDAVGPDATVVIEQGDVSARSGFTLLLLVVAAVVAGIVTTGIAVALAAADSVPDLATLSAVGAPPRIRRRFAAGQAGVIATLGGWLGAITGLALGWALVTLNASNTLDFSWQVVMPWWTFAATLIAVPLAAMALGWMTTRSRLPMVRRLAS